jgi:predicted metalloprotease
MDTEEIRATFRFLAQEKKLVSNFGIQDELFLLFYFRLNREAHGVMHPKKQKVLQ